MPRRRRSVFSHHYGAGGAIIVNHDRNEKFVFLKTLSYLERHLDRYFNPDDETLRILCWMLGADMDAVGDFLLPFFKDGQRDEYRSGLSENGNDPDCYASSAAEMARRLRPVEMIQFKKFILQELREKAAALKYRGASEIEKSIGNVREMFKLNDMETEICTFMFINAVYDDVENYFHTHLSCNKFNGRKYLTNILNISVSDLQRMLAGVLIKSGVIQMNMFDIEMNSDFIVFFQNPGGKKFSDHFYKPVPESDVSLEHHFMDKNEIRFMLDLLKKKSPTSTNLLFYGPPGTGKSSLAHRLSQELGLPAYEIVRNENNTTDRRRAALIACINMTNDQDGSLIIVDEADNLLNTEFSWFMRGETQDKGWLNEMLETPGVRIIWITNCTDQINPSVMRRFAYSHYFKSFSCRQRTRLWTNILQRNKCERFFDAAELDSLARRYRVSAGAVDLAVRKARELAPRSAEKFRSAVHIALNSHHILVNDGEKPSNRENIELNYSLDGLNLTGDLQRMMDQLERFDRYLRSREDQAVRNMNLLFYGPPGTGKSELARYIGERLDRMVICKRLGDIIDPYVGMTERHIKQAFEEAESEDCILVIDEADSLLFSREKALRSWESSMTNEFLTRMERFKGILVCTTNMMKGMDKASIRRFNHKIGFDYLKPDGALLFYERFLTPLAGAPLPAELADVLKTEFTLAPGDFKTVRDQFAYHSRKELDHRMLVEALRHEARLKDDMEGRRKLGF